MTSIVINKALDVDADTAWRLLRDVGRADVAFTPVLTACRASGDRRVVTFANGAIVTERIVAVDETTRRVAYTVTESDMNAEHHHASMRIHDLGDGMSTIEWVTDVLPDELAPGIEVLMAAGIDAFAAATRLSDSPVPTDAVTR